MSDSEADSSDDEVPELTPALLAFSKLPIGGYEPSFKFISVHPEVLNGEESIDALMMEGFNQQLKGGNSERAKRCVHQSLLLTYCQKLGKDGVALFFKRCVLSSLFHLHSSLT